MMTTVANRLLERVRRGLRWRRVYYREWYQWTVAGPLAARCNSFAERLLWPNPFEAPYQRARLAVCRKSALGDVLLCTPVLRKVKALYPNCHITFYTEYKAVLEGLPFLDAVRDYRDCPADAILFFYEHALPPRRHLARIMGNALGVRVSDVRPSCAVNRELVSRMALTWKGLPRPVITLNRHASDWTPNKEWPDEYWEALLKRLCRKYTVVEIGRPEVQTGSGAPSGNYLDLRGKTTIPELVAVIASTDLHVGPVSAPVHIAAAVGTPAVVIYGGYEHPVCSAYRGNINLYSPVPCSPCWLRAACPFAKKCLRAITPPQVEAAVERLWWRAGRGMAGEERPALQAGGHRVGASGNGSRGLLTRSLCAAP